MIVRSSLLEPSSSFLLPDMCGHAVLPIFSSLRIVKSVAPSKPPLIICFTIRWFAPLDEPATRCPYIHIRQMICNGYW